jgi:hypothetical protein
MKTVAAWYLVLAALCGACSSSNKPATDALGELHAARTCVRFVNLLNAVNKRAITGSQARAELSTMAANLQADARRDKKLAALADAVSKMNDEIKAGNIDAGLQFGPTAVSACKPLLEAHHLIKP